MTPFARGTRHRQERTSGMDILGENWRKRKGKYFRTGKAEPRFYRRGWRPTAQSLWIRGLYGDRHTLTPHERWPLDGNLEFLLLQHPNAPSGRLPHRPLLLFDVKLTSSQSEKIVMQVIRQSALTSRLPGSIEACIGITGRS